MRLRYGRWLLKRTDRTVSDIADACGFRDVPHFCRQFRVLFGMSPLQARASDRDELYADRMLDDAPTGLPWRPEPGVHTMQATV